MVTNLEQKILEVISNFSKKRNWKYGLRQKYLYGVLLGMSYTYEDISNTLNIMELTKIIYKINRYGYIYWFVRKEYRN